MSKPLQETFNTQTQQPAALSVSHLSVFFDRTPVLWEIDFEIPCGCTAAIVGPNGAGKSTLLRSTVGLIKPTSGTILFNGKPFEEMRERVAYIPQRSSVDWDFPITVRELVLMGRFGQLGLFRFPKKADYEAADHYIDALGLSACKGRQIGELSGGQQQRAFLARALLQEADIYLMDEPFQGVDHATEEVLTQFLNDLKKKGKTLVLVHHDLSTVQERFDWTLLLNMRLVASGLTKEIFSEENVSRTYGKSVALFERSYEKSRKKEAGFRS